MVRFEKKESGKTCKIYCLVHVHAKLRTRLYRSLILFLSLLLDGHQPYGHLHPRNNHGTAGQHGHPQHHGGHHKLGGGGGGHHGGGGVKGLVSLDPARHDDSEESGVGHEEDEEMQQLLLELLSNTRTPKVSWGKTGQPRLVAAPRPGIVLMVLDCKNTRTNWSVCAL